MPPLQVWGQAGNGAIQNRQPRFYSYDIAKNETVFTRYPSSLLQSIAHQRPSLREYERAVYRARKKYLEFQKAVKQKAESKNKYFVLMEELKRLIIARDPTGGSDYLAAPKSIGFDPSDTRLGCYIPPTFNKPGKRVPKFLKSEPVLMTFSVPQQQQQQQQKEKDLPHTPNKPILIADPGRTVAVGLGGTVRRLAPGAARRGGRRRPRTVATERVMEMGVAEIDEARRRLRFD